MRYCRLGTSGLKVSAIGLGGNTFGTTADESLSLDVIRAAMELGVTYIDSADTYGSGLSEEYIGKAVRGHRQDLVIATKVAVRMSDDPNDVGLSRAHIMDSVERSLKRLGTDYIDLYYAHQFDATTPIEETAQAFDDIVRQGKARYIGCSNFKAWQVAQTLGVQERLGVARWTVVQQSWNLVDGIDDPSMVEACEALGLGIVPWSPMAAGVLTGKYRRGEAPPPGTRLAERPRTRRMLNERMLDAVDRLRPWAESRGHSVGQLAIAWLASQPVVSSVIVGARRPEQVRENLRAADWVLTVEERDEVYELVHGQRELAGAH